MVSRKQRALNALAKGAAITAVGLLISKVLTYFFRIVVARFLGPEAYGQLSLGLMIAGIGGTISLLALSTSLKKFIPEFRVENDTAKIKGIVLSSVHLTLPLSLFVTLIIFFNAEFIATNIFDSPGLTPLIQIIAFKPLFSNLADIFLNTTVGFNKIIYRTITRRIIQNVVQLMAAVALIYLNFGVLGAAWGSLIGTIVAAILGLYYMEKKVGPILTAKIKPVYQHRKTLKYSTPLIFASLITSIMGWADTALLGYFMEDSDVGFYNAALPTAALVLLPYTALGSLSIPSLSELKERDKSSRETTLKTLTHWIFTLVLPLFLLLSYFSNEILNLIFGAEYVVAATTLAVLSAGYLGKASFGKVASLLKSEGHTKTVFYNSTIALVINLALNTALIPLYGIIGAAIATATSLIALNTLNSISVYRKEKIITLNKKMPKILLTGLISITPVILIDQLILTNTPTWYLFIGSTIFGTTYILLFFKWIGLDQSEIKLLQATGKKFNIQNITNQIIKHAKKEA